MAEPMSGPSYFLGYALIWHALCVNGWIVHIGVALALCLRLRVSQCILDLFYSPHIINGCLIFMLNLGDAIFLRTSCRNYEVSYTFLYAWMFPFQLYTKSMVSCQLVLPPPFHRLPFWSYAKLIVTCWLVIPYFSGAAYVYEHFVRPMFVNPQTVNIWYVPRKKDIFSKPDDILAAAEKYIEENGREAFEKLMRKVCHTKKVIISIFY